MKKYILLSAVLLSSQIMAMNFVPQPDLPVVGEDQSKADTETGNQINEMLNNGASRKMARILYALRSWSMSLKKLFEKIDELELEEIKEKFIEVYGEELRERFNELRGKQIAHIPILHDYKVVAFAFSSNNDCFLTLTEDGIIRLWDCCGGLLNFFNIEKQEIMEVKFLDRIILTKYKDGKDLYWDLDGNLIELNQGSTRKNITPKSNIIIKGYPLGEYDKSVCSNDGNYVLTRDSENNNIVYIWETNITEADDLSDLTLEQLVFLIRSYCHSSNNNDHVHCSDNHDSESCCSKVLSLARDATVDCLKCCAVTTVIAGTVVTALTSLTSCTGGVCDERCTAGCVQNTCLNLFGQRFYL